MAEKRKRSRCPKCGSLDTIRWSVRNGHQRYKCKSCSTCFTPRREDVSLSNRSAWFRKWVLGKQTIEDIASASGCSERQLRRWFAECLEKSPPRVIPHRRSVHLLADGIWFGEGRCLIVYRDADSKSTVHYRFATEENENEVIRDLKLFKELGIRISSFTTDGADGFTRAIRYACPQVPRQRCIVHIQRECLTWLTRHPRSAAGIKLRRLVCQICDIRTNNDRLYWIREFNRWHEDFEEFLMHKTLNRETGEIYYTHDNIRRAYTHIRRALPNMFKYIDDPAIPSNTNGLESFFGHLRDNLRIHRGLSVEHHDSFIRWYLFFVDEKKRRTL